MTLYCQSSEQPSEVGIVPISHLRKLDRNRHMLNVKTIPQTPELTRQLSLAAKSQSLPLHQGVHCRETFCTFCKVVFFFLLHAMIQKPPNVPNKSLSSPNRLKAYCRLQPIESSGKIKNICILARFSVSHVNRNKTQVCIKNYTVAF